MKYCIISTIAVEQNNPKGSWNDPKIELKHKFTYESNDLFYS